jgi:hypothetical protein
MSNPIRQILDDYGDNLIASGSGKLEDVYKAIAASTAEAEAEINKLIEERVRQALEELEATARDYHAKYPEADYSEFIGLIWGAKANRLDTLRAEPFTQAERELIEIGKRAGKGWKEIYGDIMKGREPHE